VEDRSQVNSDLKDAEVQSPGPQLRMLTERELGSVSSGPENSFWNTWNPWLTPQPGDDDGPVG
jgi:hypothetical protein